MLQSTCFTWFGVHHLKMSEHLFFLCKHFVLQISGPDQYWMVCWMVYWNRLNEPLFFDRWKKKKKTGGIKLSTGETPWSNEEIKWSGPLYQSSGKKVTWVRLFSLFFRNYDRNIVVPFGHHTSINVNKIKKIKESFMPTHSRNKNSQCSSCSILLMEKLSVPFTGKFLTVLIFLQ